jgi:hypothetical protein
MNENTRPVVTDLAFGVFALVMNVYLLRELREGFDRAEFDVRSATIGAIETACHTYIAEHEPVGSKLERPSGELAFFLSRVVSRRFVLGGVPSEDSASIGNSVGFLLYRVAFGVVFDLPEGRSRRWSTRLSSSVTPRVRSRLADSILPEHD